MPAAPSSVRTAFAVRPCRPITFPKSSWCTRNSNTVTCDPSTDFTSTSSGWSTRALAMASTSSFIGHLHLHSSSRTIPLHGRTVNASPKARGALATKWNSFPAGRDAHFSGNWAVRLRDLLLAEKTAYRIAGLCAKADPMLDALRVKLDFRGLLQRIV